MKQMSIAAPLVTSIFFLITVAYAWDIQDNISPKQARKICTIFHSMAKVKKKDKERQKICCYIMKEVLDEIKVDPLTIEIFLHALKPPLTVRKPPPPALHSAKKVNPSAKILGWINIGSHKDLKRYLNNKECQRYKVRIFYSQFTDKDLKKLVGANPHITKLDLSWSSITDAGLKYLPCTLAMLDMNHCYKIKGSKFKYLPKELLDLNISITSINDDSLERIKNIPLNVLDLTHTSINATGLRHLKKMPIFILSLSACTQIENRGLKHLPRTLAKLDLSWCNITDKGLKYLSNLENLSELNLSCCYNVTNNGLECLPKILTKLQLNQTKMTSERLKIVSTRCPELTILDLSECKGIRECNLEYLKDLPLRTLYLAHTAINDDGLKTIETCCPTLTYLDLTGCLYLSYTGVKRLKETLPQLKIKLPYYPYLEGL